MGHANAASADKRKRWRARNETKDRAHRAVENLVRRWRRAGVAKPSCACGRSDTHAHHSDYSRPLDVEWLCPSCHIGEAHWNGSWAHRRSAATIAA